MRRAASPRCSANCGRSFTSTCPRSAARRSAKSIGAAEVNPEQQVIRSRAEPIFPSGGIAVLKGNLAPAGAVIKHASATPGLLKHTGRAVVFDSLDALAARIDAPDLDVTADDVLVLRNAGPRGAPGMPEAGYIPIPKKLAQQGVKDMVRISDARMSGTAFGTVVLHIAPEAAVGGPLALVETGDRIRLDVDERAARSLCCARRARAPPRAAHAAATRRKRIRISSSLCSSRAAGRCGVRLRLHG